MSRAARRAPGGLVYHALNRAVARLPPLQKEGDFDAFERIMHEAMERHPVRLLAYCLMPNHWHMVLWPRVDGEMTRFLRWLTNTHTMRWHAHYHSSGTGHVYQGRFKSFPVEQDEGLLTVCRYVERNALTAGAAARNASASSGAPATYRAWSRSPSGARVWKARATADARSSLAWTRALLRAIPWRTLSSSQLSRSRPASPRASSTRCRARSAFR